MVKATVKNRIRHSKEDTIFNAIVMTVVTLLFLIVLFPLLHIVAASFSSANALYSGKVFIFPYDISLGGYDLVFKNAEFWRSYGNTILYTVVGTLTDVTVIMLCAYPLSRRELPGRNIIMGLLVFTMYFSGGMIPSFLVVRDMGLMDTMWALILPGCLSVYQMIVARTFIQSTIPREMLEAAQIDGCSDARYFVDIVLPLSKAVIAVTCLFRAVVHWNAYFDAMLYINTRAKIPVQLVLRDILIASDYQTSFNDLGMMDPEAAEAIQRTAEIMKYSLIVVSSAPIMLFYPFAQKYFIQGVMIGSVKG
ncbi:MAG: carbohydrate ABC transporter permease [Candidatus Limiplasma sp.]|nr:carbohydrate ABC transporter permease [Candidatus Limiplasma sp.]